MQGRESSANKKEEISKRKKRKRQSFSDFLDEQSKKRRTDESLITKEESQRIEDEIRAGNRKQLVEDFKTVLFDCQQTGNNFIQQIIEFARVEYGVSSLQEYHHFLEKMGLELSVSETNSQTEVALRENNTTILSFCMTSSEPGISHPQPADKLMDDYNSAEIIIPPQKLKKIYSCEEQTNDTKLNLAISYAYLAPNGLGDMKEGIQLFEIPPTEDNCQSYCGLGYGDTGGGLQNEWWNPDNSYVQLFDVNDVSCRKGFEKIFQYGDDNNHLARQWGDGTILHKMGATHYGASPIYRVADPNHPYIIKSYGPIRKIWIKPHPKEIPIPYFRWQSTHLYNYVGNGHGCIKKRTTYTLNDLKQFGDNKWQVYYEKLVPYTATTLTMSTSQPSPTLTNKPFCFFHNKKYLNAISFLCNQAASTQFSPSNPGYFNW